MSLEKGPRIEDLLAPDARGAIDPETWLLLEPIKLRHDWTKERGTFVLATIRATGEVLEELTLKELAERGPELWA